jgi:acyl-CoA thioesterase I
MVRCVAFLFAGGDAFFLGIALLAVGALLGAWRDRRWAQIGFRLANVTAWIFIATSATPLPLWLYGLGVAFTVLTILPRRLKSGKPAFWALRHMDAALVLLWCITGAAWEFSYRIAPRIDNRARYDALVVIGDSISAGMLGPDERTWPKQFRERYVRTVIDLSGEGATARSALRQVQSLDSQHRDLNALVVVEIGGNDYFESIPPADFAADLDRLLTLLARPNRQIVMLELPLPPFYNAYGRVQREMAAAHHIPLISKREFAGVVFTKDATLDTVHLSESGHALMAEMIWRHVANLIEQPAR